MAGAILSLQSQVVSGHVGNSAAAFALQRLGRDALAIPTVLYSNHPGRGRFRGRPSAPEDISSLIAGLDDIGALAGLAGILTGYLGSLATGKAALDAVALARRSSPDALYACDPVLGDEGRVYVAEGILDLFRARALAMADVCTPNLFELGLLTGAAITSADGLRRAAAALRAAGPRIVVVTSANLDDTPADAFDVIACEGARACRARLPRLSRGFSGAGDLFAAVFLARYLDGRDAARALSSAASAVHGVLERTEARNAPELALVAAQEELVAPRRVFAAQTL